jgi:hypothetical protein
VCVHLGRPFFKMAPAFVHKCDKEMNLKILFRRISGAWSTLGYSLYSRESCKKCTMAGQRDSRTSRIDVCELCFVCFWHQNLSLTRVLSKNVNIRIYKSVILPVVLYGYKTWFLTLKEERRL